MNICIKSITTIIARKKVIQVNLDYFYLNIYIYSYIY